MLKKRNKLKEIGSQLQTYLYGGLIVAFFSFPAIGNRACNNRTVQRESSVTISRARGYIAHREYTRYKNGSADLKTYPDFLGHRNLSSKLYEDLNGDGLVDRIRIAGAEIFFNRLQGILVRNTDYYTHQKQFDEADKLLAEEAAKYNQKMGLK